MATSGRSLRERLEEIRQRGVAAIRSATDRGEVERARVEYLGRSGLVSQAMSELRDLPVEEKPAAGQTGNRVKNELETTLELRLAEIEAAAAASAPTETVDLTLPGRRSWRGSVHPVTRVIDEICDIFREIGFTVAIGPEIESDWHNFSALNIPLDHPAADMHDTFYLDDGLLLRTHTSPVQARVMLAHEPPIRVLAPGLVFRRDPWDASHAPAFEQIEGLAVDEGIDFVEFRSAIDFFVQRFFGAGTRTRFQTFLLPVHGTFRRGGRDLFPVRRVGMPDLQRHGLGRDHGGRDGEPGRVRRRRLRLRQVHRLRVRHGSGPDCHASISGSRYSPPVRGRRHFSRAVRLMDVSVNWLRALAPGLQGTANEIADRLSMQAIPVDRVIPVGEDLEGIVVARVVAAERHPNADRLTLCRVDAGGSDLIDVVCGAPNVESGALYPYVAPGVSLPGGFVIESRKIRGEMSHGMLCSEKELGLGRDAGGILRLDDRLTVGQSIGEALELPDARLELDLTPNRVDLACHLGVARELAPDNGSGAILPSFDGPGWAAAWTDGDGEAESGGIRITIVDTDRCSRYLGAIVRGITVGPSPAWLQARLRNAGSRPINNVVDATNYVLLELNQPLHAFDLAKIGGSEVRVRAARRGEKLRTLDGEVHELSPTATVIADAESAIALAGVMGGQDSEVRPDTTDLLIECAAFDPRHTRHTARETGLATDASYRFERGIDESGLESALHRCVELILAIAGGEADSYGIRVGSRPPATRSVTLRISRIGRVLGLPLSAEEVAALLAPIGFETEPDADGPDRLLVTVPGWRGDVRDGGGPPGRGGPPIRIRLLPTGAAEFSPEQRARLR